MNNIFINSGILTLFLGLGKTIFSVTKLIEIDMFDIFYTIGIVGFSIWFIYMLISIRKVKLTGVYKLTFILLVMISLIAGHVLISTNVSLYLALMVILNKNEKEEVSDE